MAQSLVLKIAGLFTSNNELSEVPQGALLEADNIDILKNSIAEPRRGLDRVTGGFSDNAHRAAKTWFYQDKQFSHHGSLGSPTKVSYLDSGTWTEVGTYSAPTGVKMRAVNANQNLYFSTSTGIRKLDAYNGTSQLSGAFKALDLSASTSASTSTWLAYNSRVAYRGVWGYKDLNNNLILGAPSQRESFKNNIASKSFDSTDVNTGSDTATIAGHGYTTGLKGQVTTTGSLPTGLSAETDYFLIVSDSNTIKFAASASDASSGTAIDISDQGSGVHTFTPIGDPVAVDIRATIPEGVTTAWFFQLYRSSAVDNSSTDIEPSDELGLVYEVNPTSGDITNGYLDITDIVPDSLRGATIYTADSQEGLANQNERPPLAKDMVVFKKDGVTFYLNTTSKHRYFLTLLSADGNNGLDDDDVITIDGVDYTAKSAEDIASAQFKRYSDGSAAQNIRDTAISLIRVINRHSSSTVYAYYVSGPDDLPGQILLEERGIGGDSFALTSDAASTVWSPSLPSSGTTQSSKNDRYKNGLMWSKPNQPEAVPLGNFKEIGDRDIDGLRAIALRDALYLFKDGDGVYKLTGVYPNYTVELLDSSANLVGAETADVLNNQIYCLTDQGVTVISDSTKVISRPIEQDILRLYGQALSLVKTQAFGVAYETDRKYMLFLPRTSADTAPTQAFVYNSFTNAWTRYVMQKTCGVVYENKLYLGDALSNFINVERKTYTYLDYVDYGFSSTITDIDSRVLTLDSGIDNIAVGDIIFQSTSVFATVTAVDVSASQVTVDTNPEFTEATCDVLKAIDVRITWVPVTTGNPGISKQYNTCTLLFKADFAGTGYLYFKTDISLFEDGVPISGPGIGSWGLFPWGERPWGGQTNKRPVRQWIPLDKQRCSQLTVTFEHAYGFSPWELEGVTVFGEPGSERIAK